MVQRGPIVGDPVASGLVSSLARPGGNITGLSMLNTEISAKRVELLREVMPAVKRVAVLRDPVAPIQDLGATQAAARSLGLRPQVLSVGRPEEFHGAFRAAKNAGAEALIVLASSVFNHHRQGLVDLAADNRLIAVWEHRGFADAGGLMSYGPDLVDMTRSTSTRSSRARSPATCQWSSRPSSSWWSTSGPPRRWGSSFLTRSSSGRTKFWSEWRETAGEFRRTPNQAESRRTARSSGPGLAVLSLRPLTASVARASNIHMISTSETAVSCVIEDKRRLGQPEPRIRAGRPGPGARQEVSVRLAGDVRSRLRGRRQPEQRVRSIVARGVLPEEPLGPRLRLAEVLPVHDGDDKPVEHRRRRGVPREPVDEIGPALAERVPVPALHGDENPAVRGRGRHVHRGKARAPERVLGLGNAVLGQRRQARAEPAGWLLRGRAGREAELPLGLVVAAQLVVGDPERAASEGLRRQIGDARRERLQDLDRVSIY